MPPETKIQAGPPRSRRATRAGFAAASLALSLLAFAALSVTDVGAVVPTVTVKNASGVAYTTAHVEGTVDRQGLATTYKFQYAIQADFSDAVTGLEGTLTADSGPLGVSGDLTGLLANTTYHLRLLAINADGQSEAIAAATFKTKAAASPLIDATEVGAVSYTEATLRAKINPRGAATTYRFQYTDQAAFAAEGFASATSTPAESLTGPANPDDIASASISGLQPATTYRYRVFAENSKGSLTGPDRALHTFALPPEGPDTCPNAALRIEQHSTDLPDCRAWEMVSPPDKNGADVMAYPQRVHAAEEVTPGLPMAIAFSSLGAFADAEGTGLTVDYLAERSAAGPTGWATHSITPAGEPTSTLGAAFGASTSYLGALSPDLTSGVLQSWTPLTDAPMVAGALNLYARTDLRTSGTGAYRLVTDATVPQPVFAKDFQRPTIAGESADSTHVTFETPLNLTADASGSNIKLYLWDGTALRLLALPSCPGVNADPCSAVDPGVTGIGYTQHTISRDGSRVVYTSPVTEHGNGVNGSSLYLFDDHGTPAPGDDTTVRINATERSVPVPPAEAHFETASTDESRIFFTTAEALTDEAPVGGAKHLWMYDATAPAGERLSELDVAPGLKKISGNQGVIGASDDGHYVYFIAIGQLLEGGPPVSGDGIYLWSDANGTSSVRFVGGMPSAGDRLANLLTRTTTVLSPLTSRVTPDGRHLLFELTDGSELTPHADHGKCPVSNPNNSSITGKCSEAYLYSAESETVTCVSCPPDGSSPADSAWFDKRAGTAASVAIGSYDPNHVLSDDGRFVFFVTAQPLLPADTNGVDDAYAYDAQSGQLHLLSTGTSPYDSRFLDASPDGRDAFFSTRQRLVGWDTDSSIDIYDARVDGGFAEPPPQLAACQGESCLPSTVAAPGPTPLGSGQAGPGNPKVRPSCPKGRRAVQVHGKRRCAKKRPRHRKHPDRHLRTGSGRGGSR